MLKKGGCLWQRKGVKADDLRRLLQAAPFQPMKVCLGSSKTYSIPHPESAALSPDGATLVVFLPGGKGLDMLDVPLIERVEVRRRRAPRS